MNEIEKKAERSYHFYLGDVITFYVSKNMHNNIMEILGVKNNRTKKQFKKYVIRVK